MSILDSFETDDMNDDFDFMFSIQFGTEKAELYFKEGDERPKTLDEAIRTYAKNVGYDGGRDVTWRQGGTTLSGNTRPENGGEYIASVQHEQKG